MVTKLCAQMTNLINRGNNIKVKIQSTGLLKTCLKKLNMDTKLWKNRKFLKKMIKDTTRQKKSNKSAIKNMTHSGHKDTLSENKQRDTK